MKKIFIVVLAVAAFVACTKEKNTEERQEYSSEPQEEDTIPHPQPQPEVRGYLVQVIDSAAMNIEDFAQQVSTSPLVDYADQFVSGSATLIKPGLQGLVRARKPVMDALFLQSVGLDSRMRRQWDIESYVFSYRTTDATGAPIVLSGRVTFPNNTVAGTVHILDSYTLFTHQYVMGTDWVPSECFSMMSMRVLYNSAVIEPDGQGYGIDLHKHSVDFICFDSRARQLADCAMAAVELMRARGVELADNGYSTNWGSSLGAPVALAYARHYDNAASEQERAAIRLRSTYLGEGPLDYAAMLLYRDEHTEYQASLSSAFYGLGALTKEQLKGYEAEDFMPVWMSTSMVPFEGTGYSYFYAASHVIAGYNRYKQKIMPDTLLVNTLHEEMLDEDGHLDRYAPKTIALLEVLKEQGNYDNWQPQTDVYMAHAENDDQIPYTTVRSIYEKLQTTGATAKKHMHWLRVPISTDPLINKVGSHYGVSIEAMLYMVLAYEPKDMAIFYSLE